MAFGDILIVGSADRVYRYSNGAWDTGFAVPAGEAFPRGITVDPATGDILIVGSTADKVYRYSNGAWDNGFVVPAGEGNPRGITVDPATGDILIVGSADRVYRYSNGAWDTGFAVPAAVTTPIGITVDPATGDILIVGFITDKVYRYSNGAWDTGFAVPAAETNPSGITVDPATGDILIVGFNTDKVYRYSNGAWDTGFAVPAAEITPQGITVDGYSAVPARPAMPTLTGTDNSITAVGVEPDGDPTSYDWRIKRTSTTIWANRLDQTSLTQTWTSLQPDTEYEVQVLATNSGGDSAYSLSGILTTDPQTIPPAGFTNIPAPVAGDEWDRDQFILYVVDNLNAIHALVTGAAPGTTFAENDVIIGDTGGALQGVDLPNGALLVGSTGKPVALAIGPGGQRLLAVNGVVQWGTP